jgi:hypothetical protein
MNDETGISLDSMRDIRSLGNDVISGKKKSAHRHSASRNIGPIPEAVRHFNQDVSLEVKSDYIRAIMLRGQTLSLTQDALDTIMNAAEKHSKYRILIDSRRQYAEPSIVDCFEFAKHLAAQKPWLNFLVAVVVQNESVEAAEFAEIVAKNRGIVLKVFSHDSLAVAWLGNGKDVISTPY